MGLQDSVISTTTRLAFFDADAFFDVEATTLTLRGGTTRQVKMQIDRHPSAKGPAMEGAVVPMMIVRFANDSTYGILASECDGGMTFTAAIVKGGTAETMSLPNVPSYVDAGCVEFRIFM